MLRTTLKSFTLASRFPGVSRRNRIVHAALQGSRIVYWSVSKAEVEALVLRGNLNGAEPAWHLQTLSCGLALNLQQQTH